MREWEACGTGEAAPLSADVEDAAECRGCAAIAAAVDGDDVDAIADIVIGYRG